MCNSRLQPTLITDKYSCYSNYRMMNWFEFEKQPVQTQDFMKLTDRLWGIYEMFFSMTKNN